MMKRTRKLCCTLLILGFMLPQVMGSTADAAKSPQGCAVIRIGFCQLRLTRISRRVLRARLEFV